MHSMRLAPSWLAVSSVAVQWRQLMWPQPLASVAGSAAVAAGSAHILASVQLGMQCVSIVVDQAAGMHSHSLVSNSYGRPGPGE